MSSSRAERRNELGIRPLPPGARRELGLGVPLATRACERAIVFGAEAALERPRSPGRERAPCDDCDDHDRSRDDQRPDPGCHFRLLSLITGAPPAPST